MNETAKNILLWVIIAVVLFVLGLTVAKKVVR